MGKVSLANSLSLVFDGGKISLMVRHAPSQE
jgi:hypothetical protein